MTIVTNRNGVEFNIDDIATDLNGKVDLDGTNATFPHVVSRVVNNLGGIIEIWSDGYCIQTGYIGTGTAPTTITLVQAYADTNYNVLLTPAAFPSSSNPQFWTRAAVSKTTSSFTSNQYNDFFAPFYWRTEGYIR